MVQKLLELSSHAIRNAVINGEILSLSDLPLKLRVWMFEVFRMKQLLHHRIVMIVCRQPGFFDGFTSINIDERNAVTCRNKRWSHSTDLCFLALLASHVNSNRHLAEHLTELTFSFTPECVYEGDDRPECKCHVEESICQLLSLCKNLKRLHLIVFQPLRLVPLRLVPLNIHHSFADTPIRLPPLEHLSVIGHGCTWNLERLPRQWFESVRSLKLHEFDYEFEIYSDILLRCQDTLTSLDVSGEWRTDDFIPVPIALPELRSLSVASDESQPTIFDIVNNCPNLTVVNLKMPVYEILESELVALEQLSDRLQFFLIVSDELENFSEFIRVVGKNIYGISDHESSFTNQYSDQIFSHCSKLRILDIVNHDEEPIIYLQKILNDKEKSARLSELKLDHALAEETLKTIFANCCNLRILSLKQRSERTDVSSYVETWIANGAKPISIDLFDLDILSPETVYSLFHAAANDLINVNGNMDAVEGVYAVSMNLAANGCPFMEACCMFCCDPDKQDELAQLLSKYEKICFNHKAFDFSFRVD